MDVLYDLGYQWRSGKSLLDFSDDGYRIGRDGMIAIKYTIDKYEKTVSKLSVFEHTTMPSTDGIYEMCDLALPRIDPAEIDVLLCQ